MSLIIAEHVSFSYDGKEVLNNVTFRVNAGDYLAVIGENGSGKSTLIKGLLRLKEPSSGTILYSDGLVANEIGYLPQQSEIQRDFPASVEEVVLSGCLNSRALHPFYTKAEKQRALEQMECLKITALRKRCYRELSGGQQQRVLLARALCATKKLLLLDEPVTGLDPVVTTELYGILEHIHKEHGITIIMVTHDVECAVRHAKKILHIGKGESFFGTCEAYMQSEVGQKFLDASGHFEGGKFCHTHHAPQKGDGEDE